MAAKTRVVAVAGGTGFVGGAIARELVARGNRVVVLTHRRRKPGAGGGDSGSDTAVEYRQADVTQPPSLAAALDGVDALVIALAFRNSPIEAPRRGQTFERVDAAGTEALVAAAKLAGVGHIVYISGAGAEPNAARHWFRAKWRAEEAVRGSGGAYTIFRPSWVYGPGDRSLNRFLGIRAVAAVRAPDRQRPPDSSSRSSWTTSRRSSADSLSRPPRPTQRSKWAAPRR